MSLEITANYITPKSILLCIEDYQILLDVPSFDQVEEIEIDWGKIDYILVSSYSTAASIVYIAEYTKFSGMIFATEPTIAYSRYTWNSKEGIFNLKVVISGIPFESNKRSSFIQYV
jgi:hypothetical protein